MPLVIFDLDGTISDASHRQWMVSKTRADAPPNWREFYEAAVWDAPKRATIAVASALHTCGHELWLFSGRSDEVLAQTMEWLERQEIRRLFSQFRFRAAGDFTPDPKLKRAWYDQMSDDDKHRLLLVFDDRDRLVNMWRELGVTCFQVAWGDF